MMPPTWSASATKATAARISEIFGDAGVTGGRRGGDDAHVGQRRARVGARDRIAVAEKIALEQLALGRGLALQLVELDGVGGGVGGRDLGARQLVLERDHEIGLDLRLDLERADDAAGLDGDLLAAARGSGR